MKIQDLPLEQRNGALFNFIIEGIKNGQIEPVVCAKSVAVDAREVQPEEVGQQHTVYSQGKVEKVITLQEDIVLLTTLDRNGNPVLDEDGNENTYDMKKAKFLKTYPKEINGHHVKDPYSPGSVMVAIRLPEELIAEGITMLPPNWTGNNGERYEGTLMSGGIMMFPFNPELSLVEQLEAWSKAGADKLDWYPNNEANTYAPCDKNGTFKDPLLRKLFEQPKEYVGEPYGSNPASSSEMEDDGM